MSSERLANLKRHFQGLLEEERTGGFQILISRHGKVVMFENLGMADVEENIPISEDTLFRIFSMTKPVMGVAMMMLYEEGFYSLADPLSKYIPEFAALKVYTGQDDEGNMILEDMDREPTIQDLLQHTAGFTYGVLGDTPVDKLYSEKNIGSDQDTLQGLIDKLAESPLLFQPGSRWNYSIAVDVQGYLIEKWTGRELGAFLKERLFDPLGMDQTMAWVPSDKAALLANIYSHDESGARTVFVGPLADRFLHPPAAFSGGAQLISTSNDYWRFCQMLLNSGEFNGKRFLSPGTVEMMTMDRLHEPAEFKSGQGFGFNFAVITDASQSDFPTSNGEYYWGGLASTIFWVDPREDIIAIMLTQYLPNQNLPRRGESYTDLMHRLVRAAIID